MRISKIGIISYGVFTISNYLLVFYIPVNIASAFLKEFSLYSLVFSLSIFQLFSSELITKPYKIKIIALILLVSGAILIALNPYNTVIPVYLALIFFSDYLYATSQKPKAVIFYRFILAIPPFLLPLGVDFFDTLNIRIVFFAMAIIFGICAFHELTPLRVKAPLILSIVTNLSYFGVLYWISNLFSNQSVKYYYVAYQVVSLIFLRYLDLVVRGELPNSIKFNKKYLFIGASVPIIIAFFFIDGRFLCALAAGTALNVVVYRYCVLNNE